MKEETPEEHAYCPGDDAQAGENSGGCRGMSAGVSLMSAPWKDHGNPPRALYCQFVDAINIQGPIRYHVPGTDHVLCAAIE
jgi:hypothetical protein